MSLSEELSRLDALRQSGVLTEQEFASAKARVLASGPGCAQGDAAPLTRLRRSRSDRWIAGVCGGAAQATATESWVWRLLLTLLFMLGGAGLLLYLLLWIFVPPE